MYVYSHVWGVILVFGVGFKLLLGMSVLFQQQRPATVHKIVRISEAFKNGWVMIDIHFV